jgi:hypothetical protein
MRTLLLPLLNKTTDFTATFADQFRLRGGGKFPVVRMALLTDVRARGDIVTDHVWMNLGKRFDSDKFGFKRGDSIAFRAKVVTYVKGYLGRDENGIEGELTEDLKLAYPHDVRLATKPAKGQDSLEAFL